MPELYEYRTTGRSPLTIGVFVIALLCLALFSLDGVGWRLWSLWALLNVALGHHLLAYSVSGSRIDANCWTTFTDRRRRSIALRQIRRVVLRKARRGKLICSVHLADGSAAKIATRCLPPARTLEAKLRRKGIPVEYN